jgi:hypothetical protein
MKTEVIMKRELFGKQISQKSITGFFSATDLIKAGNLWRLQNDKPVFNFAQWQESKATKEFISELEEKTKEKAIVKTKGDHTWVHPFIFIDLALAMSPTLKIEVYSWIYDELLKYRNDSGDSYKKMAGALYLTISNKSNFKTEIAYVAQKIKEACKVDDWQNATEEQLKRRDKIHDAIFILSDVLRDVELLVITAIKKTENITK